MSRKPMLLTFPTEISDLLRKRADALSLRYSEVVSFAVSTVLESMSDQELRDGAQSLPEKQKPGPKVVQGRLSPTQALLLAVMRERFTWTEPELRNTTGLGPGVLKRALLELSLSGHVFDMGMYPNPSQAVGAPVEIQTWSAKDLAPGVQEAALSASKRRA